VNIPIIFFGTLNMTVWLMYAMLKGVLPMILANTLGVISGCSVFIAYLHASKLLSAENVLIQTVKNISKVYGVPKRWIIGNKNENQGLPVVVDKEDKALV
jgi:hypothetical protein